MGRWTQNDEDATRLPEGMERIGYDADTSRYTFRDRKGTLYESKSGEDYGHLEPIRNSNDLVANERPEAFAPPPGEKLKSRYLPRPLDEKGPKAPLQTFQDILPPELITSPTSANATPSRFSSLLSPTGTRSELSPREQFVDIVRKTALPRMQGVVSNLQRSITSVTKNGGPNAARRERSKSEVKRSEEQDPQLLLRKLSYDSMEEK